MPERICSIEDCEDPIRSVKYGWCNKHYKRWRRWGDPLSVKRRVAAGPSGSLEERFWTRVAKGDGGGCWLWTGHIDRDGYGKLSRRAAHQVAYELLVGPIPKGHEIDHVKANGCTSTACVKAVADEHGPAHLEPVTHLENVHRGYWGGRTHCKHGHPFDEANTYIDPQGNRHCRACNRRRRGDYLTRRRREARP